jgi:hypothetical protein
MLLISIGSALAAFGMANLTVFFFQLDVSDLTIFINGIMAAILLTATFTGIAIYTFVYAVRMVWAQPKPLTQTLSH